jgi:hypothetical protein
MTISLGPITTQTGQNVSSISWSHTVASAKGRQLLVGIAFDNDNFETVTGVTFGGVPLTLIASATFDDDSRSELWRLANPAVSTASIVVTLSATLTSNAGICAGSVVLREVNAAAPVRGSATNTGDSGTSSVVIASASGDLVFDVTGVENRALTVGAGQTQRWNLSAGVDPKRQDSGASTEPGAASVTMSWTHTSDKWSIVAASFRPSVVPTVDAGGPYSGDVNTAIPLNATVTPGTDPAPTFLWTIDSGPGGGVFTPSATVEDPSFTPDTVGAYTLRLTVSTVDAPDVFDTASLDSQAVATPPTVDAGGPYNGDVNTATALNATVTPGTDPTPVLLWTIDSGPGGGVFSNDAIEDPTFTPDTVGSYVLKLSADPSDGPAVTDTAPFESDDVPPVVVAGGPYNGIQLQATALDATVIPGSDPTPALLWTIDAGGTGTFLPSATIEDPTFTPDDIASYTLRLTATPSDGPPVFDTASFESTDVPVSFGQYLGGRFISDTGDLVLIELPVGTDPPVGDVVYLGGMARSHQGPIYAAIDDGIVPRVVVNGQPVQHNGVLLVNEADNPDVNLGGWAFVQQPMASSINPNPAQPLNPFIKGVVTDEKGAVRTAPFVSPGPPALANLVHWYDFDDLTTLWQDIAGTIPVTTPGDPLARVDDKGTFGTDLTDESVGQFRTPFWGFTGGTGEYDSPPGGFNKVLSSQVSPGLGGSTRSMAWVVDREDSDTGTVYPSAWQGIFGFAMDQASSGVIQGFSNATGISGPIVSKALQGALMLQKSASPQLELYHNELVGFLSAVNAVFTNPIANQDLSVGALSAGSGNDWRGTIKAVFYWDKALTAQEIQAFKDFTNFKYGITWAAAAPPADPTTGFHFFDFTDTSVLWQDILGTIPVTADGQTLRRVDNKGSSPNTATQVVAASSPIWKTPILNGLGAVRFSGPTAAFPTHLFTQFTDPLPNTLTVLAVFIYDNSDPPSDNYIHAFGSNVLATFIDDVPVDVGRTYIDNLGEFGGPVIPNGTPVGIIIQSDPVAGTLISDWSIQTGQLSQVVAVSALPANRTVMGARVAATALDAFKGDLSELVVWDTVETIASVKAYAIAKYGITWL